MEKTYRFLSSPVGELWLAMRGGYLTDLRFVGRGEREKLRLEGVEGGEEFGEVSAQLEAYFDGGLKGFDIPVRFEVGTPFQRKAWNELKKIPYGETVTYGEQARRMGRPRAARAVGGANRANPIAIIVPCHRVIGAGGDLAGFGGGVDRKEKLLRLEKAKGFKPSARAPRAR